MKTAWRLLLAWTAALALSLTAHGAGYFDAMEDERPDDVRMYYNLSPVVHSSASGWGTLYDMSFFSFSQASVPVGRAVYRVRGCEEVTVGIYTNVGTFYEWNGEGGAHILGVADPGGSVAARPQDARQALYSLDTGEAYARVGGALLPVVYLETYAFDEPGRHGLPEPGAVEDLVRYGVNVYASPTGTAYTPCELRPGMLDYRAGSDYCYEEFTAKVPANTGYIMVEINDFLSYYHVGRQDYRSKAPVAMTSLASVLLTGADLVTGPPREPEPPEPEDSGDDSSGQDSGSESQTSSHGDGTSPDSSSDKPSSDKPSSDKPSSDKPSSDKPSSDKPSSDQPSSDKPSSDKTSSDKQSSHSSSDKSSSSRRSSKFEGVIIASAKSKSASQAESVNAAVKTAASVAAQAVPQARKPAASASTPKPSSSSAVSSSAPRLSSAASKPRSSAPASQSVAERPRPVLYSPQESREDRVFTAGIAGYIAVVCGAIVFLLLHTKK